MKHVIAFASCPRLCWHYITQSKPLTLVPKLVLALLYICLFHAIPVTKEMCGLADVRYKLKEVVCEDNSTDVASSKIWHTFSILEGAQALLS